MSNGSCRIWPATASRRGPSEPGRGRLAPAVARRSASPFGHNGTTQACHHRRRPSPRTRRMNQRALALAVALLLLVLGALVFLLRGSDVDPHATAPAGTAGTGA